MNDVILFIIAGLGVLSIGLFMFLDATGVLHLVQRSHHRSERSQRIIDIVGATIGALGCVIGLFFLLIAFAAALA